MNRIILSVQLWENCESCCPLDECRCCCCCYIRSCSVASPLQGQRGSQGATNAQTLGKGGLFCLRKLPVLCSSSCGSLFVWSLPSNTTRAGGPFVAPLNSLLMPGGSSVCEEHVTEHYSKLTHMAPLWHKQVSSPLIGWEEGRVLSCPPPFF